MSSDHTAHRALSNVFWSYASFLGTKVLNLVTLVLLARWLSPGEFGIMAICVAISAYFEIVARFGLGASLISAQEDVEGMATAVFMMSMVSSVLMALALVIAAPYLADWFKMPDLVAPLRVIAFTQVVDGFGVVPAAFLAKRLRFRMKVVPDLARSVTKGVISIGMALAGMGVWALVLGNLAGTAAGVAALYVVSPWFPKAHPTRDSYVQAFRFGSHLLLAEVINAAQRNLDALLVGHLLGPAALGIYSLAFRLPDLAIRSFNQVTGVVLHPMMTEMNDGREGLKRAYLASLKYVALFTFPAGVALSVTAHPIVHILYRPQWYGMIAPMQFLSISLALLTVDFVPGLVYKAMNRTDRLLQVSILKLPIFFAVLVLSAPYGLTALSAAQIGLAVIYFIPNYLVLRGPVGADLSDIGRALAPAVLVSLGVAALGGAAGLLPIHKPAFDLAATGGAALIAYLAGLQLAAPEAIATLKRMIGKRRKSGGAV